MKENIKCARRLALLLALVLALTTWGAAFAEEEAPAGEAIAVEASTDAVEETPAEVGSLVEEAAAVETPTPAEEAAPTEAAAPAETATPAEAVAPAGSAIPSDVTPHNYILLIDNSRSTSGPHSLGGATDPKGLRFDAAQLVYQNVVSSAATGNVGKLGVVVFCGPENCVTYGPLDIQDPALDNAIGGKLNAGANAARRDDFTDIPTALEQAKAMLAGFDGHTSVILLTDGVNDLSNKPDPFNRPENIAANERSAALVGEMREAGADFFFLALTAQSDVTNSEPFMAFINSLAEAAEGEATPEGDYDNVLTATQADVGSKLVQMLIKAESASEAIQTIVEYTPVYAPFKVPYEGITDATVNITFMPEDKDLLEKAELVAPDGTTYALWDRSGPHEQADITVTESRSYIVFAIPAPQEGDWNVVVTSQKTGGDDSRVLINAVVRFNHNLRLNVEMPDTVRADEPTQVSAWFQRFDGEAFRDFEDSEIYEQSTATLTVFTPGGNERTVDMKLEDGRYVVPFRAKAAGTWSARVRVKNPYVQETTDDIAFEVLAEDAPTPTPEPTPTPRPTPTPTPTPEVIPLDSLTLDIQPAVTDAEGELRLAPGEVTFSWSLEEETDWLEGSLLRDGTSMGSIVSGISFDSSFFTEGPEYALQVSAMPKNGELAGIEPTVRTLAFRGAPQPLEAGEIALEVGPQAPDDDDILYVDRNADEITVSWQIAREAESAEGELLEDGEVLVTGLQSGDTLDRALLKDDALYTLRVSALPRDGGLVGMEPTAQTLDFRLYPLPEPILGLALEVAGGTEKGGVTRVKGNSVGLNWHYDSGNVDHYELSATDAKGNLAVRENLDAGRTSYTLAKSGKSDYTVALTAVPRYTQAGAEDAAAATATATVHTLTFLEKYWYFIAGGVALLLAGLAVLLVSLRERRAKHVAGALRVRCEALDLDQTLTFLDDRKGVKLDEPITRHPELKRMKGRKSFELLKNVRLNNDKTDRLGLAPGETLPPEPEEEPVATPEPEPAETAPESAQNWYDTPSESIGQDPFGYGAESATESGQDPYDTQSESIGQDPFGYGADSATDGSADFGGDPYGAPDDSEAEKPYDFSSLYSQSLYGSSDETDAGSGYSLDDIYSGNASPEAGNGYDPDDVYGENASADAGDGADLSDLYSEALASAGEFAPVEDASSDMEEVPVGEPIPDAEIPTGDAASDGKEAPPVEAPVEAAEPAAEEPAVEAVEPEPKPEPEPVVRHRPNIRVIRLTYTDPQTKQQIVRYVGKYDIGEVAIPISDGSQTYRFIFNGL